MTSIRLPLLLLLPVLFAQSDRVISSTDGNFDFQGRLQPGTSAVLHFRVKGGFGYRVRLGGPDSGRLDDPGRRVGVLAATSAKMSDGLFRLTVNGPRIQLERNGTPIWEYVEKEAGLPSSGAVRLEPANGVTDVQFQALPPTPPSFAERYGPGIGEKTPAFSAVDQMGKVRDFASLQGPKGLWLLFVRSADWCVFCKTQLVEMGKQADRVRALGYEVAALTYDQPGALAHFAQRRQIQYPLLSDPQSVVIDAFGIRNETATTGFAKGVPHPGLFLIGADGRVEGKYMEEDYKEHLTMSSILSGRFGERAAPAGATVDRPRIRVTPSANVTVVKGGQKARLSIDAILGRGLHAYAPGAPEDFIPVSWQLTAADTFSAGEPEWPVAEKTQLYGFDEKVPNYTGRLQVSREITLPAQSVLMKLAVAGEITITGAFRYQACNDRVCFPPETVPLTWTLLVEGHDRERVPKALQRPDR